MGTGPRGSRDEGGDSLLSEAEALYGESFTAWQVILALGVLSFRKVGVSHEAAWLTTKGSTSLPTPEVVVGT